MSTNFSPCILSFRTNDVTNFLRVTLLYVSAHLSFLMLNFCPKTPKFEWQWSQYLELNPTCGISSCLLCLYSFFYAEISFCLFPRLSRGRGEHNDYLSILLHHYIHNVIADYLKLQFIAVFNKVEFFASPFNKFTNSGHCTFLLSFHIFQTISESLPWSCTRYEW